MIYWVSFIASLAGFLFGYDEGIIAGSIGLIRNEFSLSHGEIAFLAAALPCGALVSACYVGWNLSRRDHHSAGRRAYLSLSGALFFIGAIGAASAIGVLTLTMARFVLGIAIGVASVVGPLYLAEVAHPKRRGATVAVYQLAITFGILSAYVVNYFFIFAHAWRIMFATSVVPALGLAVGMGFLPESPRWLLARGASLEGLLSLRRLRGTEDNHAEATHIESTLANEPRDSDWHLLFKNPLKQVLGLGICLFALQQLSGINVIISFAPELFRDLGIADEAGRILATVGIGITNVLVTFIALKYVDQMGRRKLLLMGFMGASLSLLILSIITALNLPYLAPLSVICLMFYIISFALSIGPVPHITASEIFPLHVRGAGMGLSLMSNWFFNTLVVFSFPVLESALPIGEIFAILGIICGLGWLYAFIKMPETMGISLESIEDHLMAKKSLAELGRKSFSARLANENATPQEALQS